MKHVDVKSNTYIDSDKEINEKDPKFKIGDTVKISKYQNIFEKGYTSNWSDEVFVMKKVKNTVPKTLLMILMGKELLELFMKRNCKKQIKQEFRNEKVIKRKGDKLYVK